MGLLGLFETHHGQRQRIPRRCLPFLHLDRGPIDNDRATSQPAHELLSTKFSPYQSRSPASPDSANTPAHVVCTVIWRSGVWSAMKLRSNRAETRDGSLVHSCQKLMSNNFTCTHIYSILGATVPNLERYNNSSCRFRKHGGIEANDMSRGTAVSRANLLKLVASCNR